MSKDIWENFFRIFSNPYTCCSFKNFLKHSSSSLNLNFRDGGRYFQVELLWNKYNEFQLIAREFHPVAFLCFICVGLYKCRKLLECFYLHNLKHHHGWRHQNNFLGKLQLGRRLHCTHFFSIINLFSASSFPSNKRRPPKKIRFNARISFNETFVSSTRRKGESNFFFLLAFKSS